MAMRSMVVGGSVGTSVLMRRGGMVGGIVLSWAAARQKPAKAMIRLRLFILISG